MDLMQLSKNKGFISKDKLIQVNKDYYLWMCDLQRWLREKYHIYVLVEYVLNRGWGYKTLRYRHPNQKELDSNYAYNTYEDALERGLYIALKFI